MPRTILGWSLSSGQSKQPRMKRIIAIALFSLAAACAAKQPADTQPAGASSQPADTNAAAAEMKDCTCTAAPTEACQPNCPPITWKSADCESANGRPKACAEPATH